MIEIRLVFTVAAIGLVGWFLLPAASILPMPAETHPRAKTAGTEARATILFFSMLELIRLANDDKSIVQQT